MAPTDNDTGLTLRELVLEVRSDVKDLKDDLVPRVQALETDGVRTKAVAAALLTRKNETFSRKQKAYGLGFAIVTVLMNGIALAPIVSHF